MEPCHTAYTCPHTPPHLAGQCAVGDALHSAHAAGSTLDTNPDFLDPYKTRQKTKYVMPCTLTLPTCLAEQLTPFLCSFCTEQWPASAHISACHGY